MTADERAAFDQLAAQRDALLAACKRALLADDIPTLMSDAASRQLRDAIALAEGGAPIGPRPRRTDASGKVR